MTAPTEVLSFVVESLTGICCSDYPRGLPGTEARNDREGESLVREKEEMEEMERDVL